MLKWGFLQNITLKKENKVLKRKRPLKSINFPSFKNNLSCNRRLFFVRLWDLDENGYLFF